MPQPQKPSSESGSSPPRRLTLTHVDLVPGGTVGTGVGLDAQGDEVSFAGGWSPLLQCALASQSGGTIEVYLSGGARPQSRMTLRGQPGCQRGGAG